MLSFLLAQLIATNTPLVTQKYYNEGDCAYVRLEYCTFPEYGVYCDNGTYRSVTARTYFNIRVGDNCPV